MQDNASIDKLFTPVLLLLILLSVAILWSARFPPMQDYPTHLMIAKILATANGTHYNWNQYYTVDHDLGPYRQTYFVLVVLQRFLDIETAGKLLISPYFLLVSGFIYHQSRRRAAQSDAPSFCCCYYRWHSTRLLQPRRCSPISIISWSDSKRKSLRHANR